MTQLRNKYNMEKLAYNEKKSVKTLPNFFDEETGEMPFLQGMGLSVLTHVLFFALLVIVSFLHNLIFPYLPKPELPNRNLEFKLVQNESKPPINKNTKNRSDRDSRAGGKHDPKKIEAEPRKASVSQAKKPAVQKPVQKEQPKKEIKKSVAQKQPQNIVQKQPQKQEVKPVEQPQKVVEKPTPIKPSAVKPTVKPVVKPQGAVVPNAPKVVSAPKSPFVVAAPKTSAPVGTTYKSSGAPSVATGSNTVASSAPAPKFSSTGASSSGSLGTAGGGQYASRGSYGGYGSAGNPSPGNPNGTPGIDAIRQPNWGPYMKDLEQRIKRNWTPPKGDSSKRVVITFTIGRDGRLLSAKVTKSSGVPLADRAAMSAIELTAPFRPLPPEFRGQSVPIEFTFDYNVINSVLR